MTKEITGNLFKPSSYSVPIRPKIICITTNGILKQNGSAVMGRGCAKDAADRWPDVPNILGRHLCSGRNVPYFLRNVELNRQQIQLWSFPTKNDWRKPSNIKLIARSALRMLTAADQHGFNCIVIPRPGCANGGLSWEFVGPVLADLLDERFWMICC